MRSRPIHTAAASGLPSSSRLSHVQCSKSVCICVCAAPQQKLCDLTLGVTGRQSNPRGRGAEDALRSAGTAGTGRLPAATGTWPGDRRHTDGSGPLPGVRGCRDWQDKAPLTGLRHERVLRTRAPWSAPAPRGQCGKALHSLTCP